MQLLDQPETSQTNIGSKIESPLFLTGIQYLCFKFLMGLGVLVVLAHKVKSIFFVQHTNNQHHGWHLSTKTTVFPYQENKP
jgi:hypothetical protein